ncbi:MAG: hypothetical protein KatS3mg121_0083 [Gammaproteobacteria bacterium]|nr:MAG: hypothetical protein KatS3mg121_0083 [Gammaproteobacteria bacterium]
MPEQGDNHEVKRNEAGQDGAAEAARIEELEAALAEARAEAERQRELALRLGAELDNLRKRVQRDIENAHKYGLEKLAGELLAVRDSMELGLGAAGETTDVESLRQGIELTLKLLAQVMEKFGIEEIDPVNERFNPELHQAMATQPSARVPPNTVLSVMQKGYLLNGRLLRPALVIVATEARDGGEAGGEGAAEAPERDPAEGERQGKKRGGGKT